MKYKIHDKKKLFPDSSLKIPMPPVKPPKEKGGYRKIAELDGKLTCSHPDHNPPMHVVLSPGVWEYECPACGKTTITVSNPPTL